MPPSVRVGVLDSPSFPASARPELTHLQATHSRRESHMTRAVVSRWLRIFLLPWGIGVPMLALSSEVIAQNTGTITGRVTDVRTQLPISGAAVDLPGNRVATLT